MKHEQPRRNPDGLVRERPIALRLMPGELADAKAIAEKKNFTLSALARTAYLAGLPLVLSSPSEQGHSVGGEEHLPAASFSKA